jgi:hypothetical protein
MSAALPRFTWDQPRRAVATVAVKVNFEKRHFQHIAEGIQTAPVDEETRGKLANHFATHLAGTNANFNRDRFVGVATGQRAS